MNITMVFQPEFGVSLEPKHLALLDKCAKRHHDSKLRNYPQLKRWIVWLDNSPAPITVSYEQILDMRRLLHSDHDMTKVEKRVRERMLAALDAAIDRAQRVSFNEDDEPT